MQIKLVVVVVVVVFVVSSSSSLVMPVGNNALFDIWLAEPLG